MHPWHDIDPGQGAPAVITMVVEIPKGSGMRAIGNDTDYGIASQALDIPVKAGDIFTIEAVVRASEDARIGIAAVQEMERLMRIHDDVMRQRMDRRNGLQYSTNYVNKLIIHSKSVLHNCGCGPSQKRRPTTTIVEDTF